MGPGRRRGRWLATLATLVAIEAAAGAATVTVSDGLTELEAKRRDLMRRSSVATATTTTVIRSDGATELDTKRTDLIRRSSAAAAEPATIIGSDGVTELEVKRGHLIRRSSTHKAALQIGPVGDLQPTSALLDGEHRPPDGDTTSPRAPEFRRINRRRVVAAESSTSWMRAPGELLNAARRRAMLRPYEAAVLGSRVVVAALWPPTAIVQLPAILRDGKALLQTEGRGKGREGQLSAPSQVLLEKPSKEQYGAKSSKKEYKPSKEEYGEKPSKEEYEEPLKVEVEHIEKVVEDDVVAVEKDPVKVVKDDVAAVEKEIEKEASKNVTELEMQFTEKEDQVYRGGSYWLSALVEFCVQAAILTVFGGIYYSKVTKMRAATPPSGRLDKCVQLDRAGESLTDSNDFRFQFGLCGCFGDFHTCLHGWCCGFVRAADTAAATGLIDFWTIFILYLLLLALYSLNPLVFFMPIVFSNVVLASVRQQVRARYGGLTPKMDQVMCIDCITMLCCWPCATCQEARHADRAGRVEVKCCFQLREIAGGDDLVGQPLGIAEAKDGLEVKDNIPQDKNEDHSDGEDDDKVVAAGAAG